MGEALRPVLKHTNWENRLDQIIEANLKKSGSMCDFVELNSMCARIFFELVTDTPIPEADIEMIREGVQEWRLHLSGKGIGNHAKKEKVLSYMKNAVKKIDGHPLDENDIYTMSAIMQPLFVSPMINIPDVFAVAEKHLKEMPKEKAQQVVTDDDTCEAFLKECLRMGHPFPIVERQVRGGPLGSYQVVGRYDAICKNGPEFNLERWRDARVVPPFTGKCPYEPMLFGTGPRRCQGSMLAMKLMKALLKHYAADLEQFS